ncbi:hypothetical protein Ctob_012496 [Chrysochromulina tobinii]|uniref:EF-hand domain-containing protein n=1 Tax=Chrysochromulina tobinii TaxID=1460289 RepID=A0A0M0JIM8_9EUKA|nr:hypothetical protein Ctob_012496 [Chrysochromulina tobinii]|eukprot:KOO26350.1 hypothetical protein Ctob_012496 [Chrysochromulina sp. CCMP291]
MAKGINDEDPVAKADASRLREWFAGGDGGAKAKMEELDLQTKLLLRLPPPLTMPKTKTAMEAEAAARAQGHVPIEGQEVTLSFQDVCKYFAVLTSDDIETRAAFLFDLYDFNNSGSITISELSALINAATPGSVVEQDLLTCMRSIPKRDPNMYYGITTNRLVRRAEVVFSEYVEAPPATIAQTSELLGSELPDDPSAVQSSSATTGSPSSPKKGKPRSPQLSESSSLSPQLRRMLRKASPSPRKTKQAIPDDQELERRSQVRGLMHLWNKCDFRYEDLLRLRKLRLSNRALDDDDIGALCAVLDDKMKQVSELDLVGNRLRDASLVALGSALERGAVPHLTTLHVDRNRMGDAGLKALAAAINGGALSRLTQLFLNGNSFSSSGVVALAETATHGHLAELTCLGLSGNEAIGDEGIEAIAQVATKWMPDREDVHEDRKCFPQLKELHMRGVGVGDRGLNVLASAIEPKSGGLPSLRTIFVSTEHLQHPALKTACCGRGGKGAGHAVQLEFF